VKEELRIAALVLENKIMASLLVLTGPRKGTRLELQEGKTVLGREAGCDIVINETLLGRTGRPTDSISRRHAIISFVGGDYFIEDGDGRGTRSRNGTLVNEQPVPFPGSVSLHNNDCIRICDFCCTFREDNEPAFAVEATLDHESSVHTLQAQPAEKLQVILEISNSLSTALEMDSLLPRIIDHLFRLFRQADRGFIILQDEASAGLVVRAFKARTGTEGDTRFSTSIVWRCLEKVQAILGNDLPNQFPDSESVSDLPVRSLLCAPLWSPDGQALGAIQLDTSATKGRFTQDDLNLLLGVASQASIALYNARLHQEALVHHRRERDLEVAREVQRALLPRSLPDIPGYEFFARDEPAREIGGDYYDFLELPGRRLAILLGDVAGKGVPAALVMVKFSVEARVCMEAESDLAVAVTRLNTVMTRAALSERFVTLVAVILDPATHSVTLVNAGHPSPLLIRRASGAVEEAAPPALAGPPITVVGDYAYTSCEIRLQPGDNLLLFSDGVTDAMDTEGRQFRPRGIRAVLKSRTMTPRETGERLFQAVKQHAVGSSQIDDITLVCFGRMGP
jgi:serine phosphatase RsbU (regulator of sigma subunit)